MAVAVPYVQDGIVIVAALFVVQLAGVALGPRTGADAEHELLEKYKSIKDMRRMHASTLRALASRASSVAAFGIHEGSHWALLQGLYEGRADAEREKTMVQKDAKTES